MPEKNNHNHCSLLGAGQCENYNLKSDLPEKTGKTAARLTHGH